MASTITKQEIIEPGAVVHTTICYDPFNSVDRDTGEITWRDGLTLTDALGPMPEDIAWLVMVNGKIKTSDDYDHVYLHANDNLYVQPIPEGGKGGAKSILLIVAAIALAVVAPYIGAALFGSGTLLAAVATGVILAVGGALLSALVPPPDEISSESDSDEATYGIDGPKNTSAENQSVPLVYGTYRVGGNITNIFTEPDETDSQIVRMMSVVSEGQIEDISDYYVNGQSIDKYRDVSTSWRRGALNQSKIEWFDDSIVPVNRNATLTTDYTQYTTTQDVNALRLDIVFPGGLVRYNDEAKKIEHAVTIEGDYRRVGDVTWIPIFSGNSVGNVGNTGSGFGRLIDGSTGSTTYAVPAEGRALISGKQRSTMRRYFEIKNLVTDKYEFRIRRIAEESDSDKIVENVVLSDVNEIRTEDISYRNTAHYGVSIRLTDQLSSIPQISGLVKGIRVGHYDMNGTKTSTVWSANPAWIVIDLLTNKRYGGGLPVSNIDWPRFVEWAAHNVAKGIEFNGMFTDTRTVWDCVQDVMRVTGAQIVRSGTKYTVIVEKEEEPTAMFNNSNIIEDSMSINWLPADSRANVIEVRFYDEAEGYKARTIRVVDYDALARGVPERPVSVLAKGITNIDKAYFYANVILARNKYTKQTITFDAHHDAITSVVGDVIYVQHDMPQWGFGGRLAKGSTASLLKFDRDVEMAAGSDYSLIIRHSYVARHSSNITSITGNGNFVNVNGPLPAEPFTRLRMADGSADSEIVAFTDFGTFAQYQVEDGTGFVAGQTAEVCDVDVLDKLTIANIDAFVGKEYTLATPLQAEPEMYAPYAIGRVEQASKKMRISSIDSDKEMVRTITALEYNPSVYTDPENAAAAPQISALNDAVLPVVGVTFTEDLVVVNGQLEVRLATSWAAQAGSSYGGAQVTYYDDDGYVVDTKILTNDFLTDIRVVEDSERVRVEIWPYSIAGAYLEPTSVVRYYYVVAGKTADPLPVDNVKVIPSNSGAIVTWDFSPELDVVGYDVYYGPDFGSAASLGKNISSNSIFTDQVDIGLNVYHIVAIDSLGNRSIPTVATYEKVSPPPVEEFNAVRVGQTISLEWRAVEGISFYEIRRGTSWAAGALVTRVDAIQFTTPVDHTVPNQTFFIKTVDGNGDYSTKSSFVTIAIEPLSLRNILVQESYRANLFEGGRVSILQQIDDDLQVVPGRRRGEYVLPPLPAYDLSRVIYDDLIYNSNDFTDTWADADYSWDDPKTDARFEEILENQDAIFFRDVSLKDDTPIAGVIEQVPLNGDLITTQGLATVQKQTGTTYTTSGRFRGGLNLSADLASTQWLLNTLPVAQTEIKASIWFTPTDLTLNKFPLRLFDNAANDRVEVFATGSSFAFRTLFTTNTEGNTTVSFDMKVELNNSYYVAIEQHDGELKCSIYDYAADEVETQVIPIVTPLNINSVRSYRFL